jgi:hypothetical protein
MMLSKKIPPVLGAELPNLPHLYGLGVPFQGNGGLNLGVPLVQYHPGHVEYTDELQLELELHELLLLDDQYGLVSGVDLKS